jgi:hypothetical protein
MSSDLYTRLSWLPQPPLDFNAQCRSLIPSFSGAPFAQPEDPGKTIRRLASHALDDNQLNRLAKAIGKAGEGGRSLKPLVPFKLGLLSNSTTDFVVPCLIASAARHGIALECVTANYDQVMQDALAPDSSINQAKPDAVLVAIDYRALPLRAKLGSVEDADRAVRAAVDYIETVRSGLRANGNGICIVQTLAPPPERLFGSLDRMLPGSLRNSVERVNSALAASVFGTPDILLDVAGLAGTWRSCPFRILTCRSTRIMLQE